jgi:glutathione S-transferase
MTEAILHHYDMSPFAEKIRLALGIKGATWHSVQSPIVMPKPDHVELTGGYRRVPVLQLGADIYCDTHCIARVLDEVLPGPALYPAGQETLAHSLSKWSETTFMMVVLAFFGIGGVFPEEFVEDRRKTMVPPGTDLDQTKIILASKLVQIRANLDRIEGQLCDGRPFLLGETPCIADLSAFHPIMFLSAHERTAALLSNLEWIPAWLERVRAIGHGKPIEMDSHEAIAIAKAAEPAIFPGEPVVPEGIALGTPVIVLPDEFGSGNVAGTLAESGLHEIAVRRSGDRVGDVVVHFPREEYAVIATG